MEPEGRVRICTFRRGVFEERKRSMPCDDYHSNTKYCSPSLSYQSYMLGGCICDAQSYFVTSTVNGQTFNNICSRSDPNMQC
ncbi:hypothetical protein AX16_005429 [Volvariella volvacea WC 439]|nr:hypothetical protein AX16_005429 [Volvariella volvacea WC 439]